MATEPAIGTRIKKRRQVLRMTQQELADKLDVSKSTVANWERNKHFPLRYLGALEEVLGISLDGGDGGQGAELVSGDEWERSVLSDPDLPYDVKRALISDSRAARAAYRGRSGSRGTGRTAGPRGTAAG